MSVHSRRRVRERRARGRERAARSKWTGAMYSVATRRVPRTQELRPAVPLAEVMRRVGMREQTRRHLLAERVRRLPVKQVSIPVMYHPGVRDRLLEIPGNKSVCAARSVRRAVLFAYRVAGRSGGSPGRDRTYRRKEESLTSCGRR